MLALGEVTLVVVLLGGELHPEEGVLLHRISAQGGQLVQACAGIHLEKEGVVIRSDGTERHRPWVSGIAHDASPSTSSALRIDARRRPEQFCNAATKPGEELFAHQVIGFCQNGRACGRVKNRDDFMLG